MVRQTNTIYSIDLNSNTTDSIDLNTTDSIDLNTTDYTEEKNIQVNEKLQYTT